MPQTEEKRKKVIIVGLSNSGKSHLFNHLTGEYNLVANYPFTTMEMKCGECKFEGETYTVVDTPGLHCLSIHSEEELEVRELLLKEKPDVVVQCVDANRLRQSLLLTIDLLELEFPVVLAINAIDETARKGVWLDSDELSRLLGVSVVETVAVNGLGIKEIKRAVQRVKRHPPFHISYGNDLDSAIEDIGNLLPEEIPFRRKMAALLLQGDPYLRKYLEAFAEESRLKPAQDKLERLRWQSNGNVAWHVNRVRNRWVDTVFRKVVHAQKVTFGSFSEVLGRLSRHPVFGIPILLGVLALIFFSVVDVANVLASWMQVALWVPVETLVSHHVSSGFWGDFLIGQYGILTFGFANALLTVLPILSVFYLEFGILEDMGYIPNLSVLSKRIFAKLGLSGSAILPLSLGFGCKTMATLTTRSLSSKKERFICVFLIAFAIPCAAQMAINMSILGRLGLSAFLIAFFTLMVAGMLAAVAFNLLLQEKNEQNFLMELPPIRLPLFRSVLVKTHYRLYWFLKEALPLFILTAVVMFTIERIGVLQVVKRALEPVVGGFLGLPLAMVDVLIVGVARREAAAALVIGLVQSGQLNAIQCIVSVILISTFIPCLANIVAMGKEIGVKRMVFAVLAISVSSILLSGGMRWILERTY